MAESICRTLRDGGLEGEHAPALTIKDTIRCPLGLFVLDHILCQVCSFVLSHRCQSKGIVLVALSRSPIYYEELLKSQGYDVASSSTWIKVVDCYSDPFGWKRKLVENGIVKNLTGGSSITVKLCENVEDLEKLSSYIVELGKEMIGDGKGRFMVAIDSVSEMLRLTSLTSVAVILSNLRSHDNVSCLFWLLHSDLHDNGITAALEYMSSMQASIEPMARLVDEQRRNSENISWMEQNLRRGKFCVRLKRRNGRVRVMHEELRVEKSGIKFSPVSFEDDLISQSIVPKVQFNLQLSEKERNDRAKVVLPFEHQGNGKNIQIYDGRKPLDAGEEGLKNASERVQATDPSKGEIIYFRDSDDEMPDSDEDPDDDLDI
ncbi:elongator complex protein 5 [Primulina eburnea]|uniref:elongator complex protein 5 n=1 Tax=Primulina eburnea TaxID=1245227 RepID=UPI003C6C4FFE